MSIYADKKAGQPTGRWCVEVQKGPHRLRGRFNSMQEAKEGEAEFTRRLEAGEGLEGSVRNRKRPTPTPNPASGTTILEGIRKAEGRLWSGGAAEPQAFKQLETIAAILGPDTPLNDISTTDVDDVIEVLKGRGLSRATINRYLAALSKFLKWCLPRGHRTTPLPEIAWGSEEAGRIRWITPEEEAELYTHLSSPVSLLVKNAILTGMRRSELLTLQTEQLSKGWVHLWKTKSGSPRSVPISPESYASLKWLVSSKKMPDIQSLRYEWTKARKAMGLEGDPWFVFHACRHTCATRLVQANVNLKVIQAFLGHRQIATTLRYAHLNDTSLSNALGALLRSQDAEHLGATATRHHATGGLGVAGSNPVAPTSTFPQQRTDDPGRQVRPLGGTRT